MPVALAEIEDRLEEIRYRLNRRTLVAVLSPIVATLLILASLVTWSAARGTAESFAIALWAAVAAAVIVLVWAGLVLRQRWLTLADAARVADARGAMRERLSTILWLSRSGAQPPLAPVLVADALELRPAWQASAIIPRRFPWELGFPLAALLGLAAVVFLDNPLLPPLGQLMASLPPAERQMEMAVPFPPSPPTPSTASVGADPGEALLEAATGDGSGEGGEMGIELGGQPGERAPSSAVLTAQVRDAIRKALQRFEQTDRPRDLAQPQGDSGADLPETDLPPKPGLFDVAAPKQFGAQRGNEKAQGAGAKSDEAQKTGRGTEATKRGRDATESVDAETKLPTGRNDLPKNDKRAVEADPYQPRREDADVASMPGAGEAPETQDGTGSGGREHDQPADEARMQGDPDPKAKPRPGDAGVAGNLKGVGNQKGGARAATSAGTGDGEGLFGPAPGPGGKKLRGGPQETFKLTLGSFLTAGPGTGEKPKQRERVAAANPRAAVTEPPALNPSQTADDALRRADIPPEYEEIVRRIYSSRTAR